MTDADFSVGDDVLEVDIPADIVTSFEQPDDGMLPADMAPYRAFVVPAEIVNRYAVRRLERD